MKLVMSRLHGLTTATIDVKVVFTREYRFRQWAASQLIRLAGWVIGIGVNVEFNGEKQ